jgi:putative proteasome-type protease
MGVKTMTYGVGILVKTGLVLMADTRTNAGIDNVATFRKLHIFEKPGGIVAALATAGNLSVTQSIIAHLKDGIDVDGSGTKVRLADQTSMFEAAQLVGHAVRKVYGTYGSAMEHNAAAFDVTMLLGGQAPGQNPHLYLIYKAGNFIEATADSPFLQIGEHKYGKPILDRAVKEETDLYEALKLGLISMDSTMRSNLGVGLPVDFVVLRKGGANWEMNRRIEAGDPYFHDLRERWSYALRKAHMDIPLPPYERQS